MKIEDIKELVEHETGFSIEKRTRKREVVIARGIYFVLAKEFCKTSYTKIGKSLGYDHATVMHWKKKLPEHLPYETILSHNYYKLKRNLKGSYHEDKLTLIVDEQAEEILNNMI